MKRLNYDQKLLVIVDSLWKHVNAMVANGNTESLTASDVRSYSKRKYRKRGKIRWAKLSWIPPNVVFHGKTFAVSYVYNTKTVPLYEA